MRRSESRWMTGFGRWVSDYRVSRLVSDLARRGIPLTENAVYAWVAGDAQPRYQAAEAMVKLSGGALDIGAVYAQRELVRSGGGGVSGPVTPGRSREVA